MSNRQVYIPGQLFTGDNWLNEHAIVTTGTEITAIIPADTLPDDVLVTDLRNGILVPAFIDVQLYGAGKRLFSAFPDTESLSVINESNRRGGTALCLPTIATNTQEVCLQAIDAVNTYQANGGHGIYGVHLEGPWLHPARRGAHIESLIHPPTIDEVKKLLDHGDGVIKMITLAPEVCPDAIIQLLLDAGIILSAGHSNATYQEATAAFGKGITAVTHLFNAMSPLHHREPGLAGAAMDDKRVMASIIPDGYHVDFAAVRIAKAAMGERLFAITDAVTETPTGPYRHTPAGDKYEAAGILSGSALTMERCLHHLVKDVQLDTAEALRMCSLYPARMLRLDSRLGKIEPGYRACFTLLDKNLHVTGVIGTV
ncbi:N-acetylglucosamine-6-phosphate deacetylase [Nostoc ellipsosporum NOK]|nr:N-acetylglucosamine-6-phosphate deacetylase [Nostoc ellipsosporum NOK]